MSVSLHHGDCLEVMAGMIADGLQFDSCVTDPPYHLTSIVKRFGGANAAKAQHGSDGLYARATAGFMGKAWDGGDIAFRPETWRLVWDLLKPGAYLVAFSGTRTYHRMACAIEDAGFDVRDMIAWTYGSGFPKSHDISKAIDKAAGAERTDIIAPRRGGTKTFNIGGREKATPRAPITAPASEAAAEWDGWGTALKPALEPICLAQKPFKGTIAANVLKHGVGALNIDGCRIHSEGSQGREYSIKRLKPGAQLMATGGNWRPEDGPDYCGRTKDGRWPANLVHDGSDEVLACFPDSAGQLGRVGPEHGTRPTVNVYGDYGARHDCEPRGDCGSAARFFYSAKADSHDRWGSKHPTVKPVDLIRWLARLVTPPGGMILEPFAGSGTLGVAALAEKFSAALIEREAEYVADIRERLAFYQGGDRHSVASKNRNAPIDHGPLFGDPDAAVAGGFTGCSRTNGPIGLRS